MGVQSPGNQGIGNESGTRSRGHWTTMGPREVYGEKIALRQKRKFEGWPDSSLFDRLVEWH